MKGQGRDVTLMLARWNDGFIRILLGRIGRAQGLKGEVRLTSFTGDPLAIADYGPLESEDGTRRFEIERISQRNDVVVAKLKGVDDRSAAEALTNEGLWIAREKLPAAEEEDEFLLADLIGCVAHAPDGRHIGEVVDVPNMARAIWSRSRCSARRMRRPRPCWCRSPALSCRRWMCRAGASLWTCRYR